MKYFVSVGSSPTLNCINDKFVADFALGIGISRPRWNSQQNKQFNEKLQTQFTAYFPQLVFERGEPATSDMQQQLAILTQLITLLKPEHTALQAALARLNQLAQSLMGMQYKSFGEEIEQLERLRGLMALQCKSKQDALKTLDVMDVARASAAQTLSRWESRSLAPFSPAGRCYAVIQELLWGMYGQIIRWVNPGQKRTLLYELRETLVLLLANDVNASPHTRHYYHDWLATQPSSGVMEYKEALAWLGDTSDIDRQPVSYSITQTWRGISLGMPRICSAQRISYAMIDEAFD